MLYVVKNLLSRLEDRQTKFGFILQTKSQKKTPGSKNCVDNNSQTTRPI
jgi:hypothetical protein